MTAAIAPIPREILVDRWQGAMKWERTYGNASDEYLALVNAISDLIVLCIADEDVDDYLDEDLLDRIGDVVVDRIEAAMVAIGQ
jgi:hypothetical protein